MADSNSDSEEEYLSAEEADKPPRGAQWEDVGVSEAMDLNRDKNHSSQSTLQAVATDPSILPQPSLLVSDEKQTNHELLEEQAGASCCNDNEMYSEEGIRTNLVKGDMEGASTVAEPAAVDCATGLDNRYVSEDVTVKGSHVELTEEQMKELREQANKLKLDGNECFRSGEYSEAAELYSKALELYPPLSDHEASICFANRAACFMKTDEHQSVVDDCTKALELKPEYLKALVRRAQANEALEKYEDALEDYKKALELDPSQAAARQAILYLPDKIKEQQEKLKEEMLGKLKDLGNTFLKPFGLSTSNFQFQQDPNTGGYSVNFKR